MRPNENENTDRVNEVGEQPQATATGTGIQHQNANEHLPRYDEIFPDNLPPYQVDQPQATTSGAEIQHQNANEDLDTGDLGDTHTLNGEAIATAWSALQYT